MLSSRYTLLPELEVIEGTPTPDTSQTTFSPSSAGSQLDFTDGHVSGRPGDGQNASSTSSSYATQNEGLPRRGSAVCFISKDKSHLLNLFDPES